jgi:hypothetical protein
MAASPVARESHPDNHGVFQARDHAVSFFHEGLYVHEAISQVRRSQSPTIRARRGSPVAPPPSSIAWRLAMSLDDNRCPQTNANAVSILCSVILIAFLGCASSEVSTSGGVQASSQSENPTATRIQGKIARVGAHATRINQSGGDVSKIQQAMQQVDQRLKAGDHVEAERILDGLLKDLGEPVAGLASAPAASRDVAQCDPRRPMTVSGRVTVQEDCTIGGDLTVTGSAVLHFDYKKRSGGRVVVNGNVVVQDDASLQVEGRPGGRAVLVIDNEFDEHRSMTSRDRATVKLNHVEFRTQKAVDRSKGSVSMSYHARGRSSIEVTGSTIVEAESWLLGTLYDSARLTVVDTQHVPNEIYVHDSSIATIRGATTRTGVWLDAQGAKGTVTVPNVNGPFSWRIGAGNGLNVGWLLQVENAEPGLGLEIKTGTALTVTGNGARAPATGELKISYFVINSRETLDGLKAGLQNRTISDRLTLKDVQLGPIAWQVYAGDNADLTITNSLVNEIGLIGRDARVRVEKSVLQLAVLAAMAPGSSLAINSSEVWNQAIWVASKAQVSITDSEIHGTLFHAFADDSRITIKGGTFHDNPGSCSQATMVNIATGQPRCNPFSAPGRPRSSGAGKVDCAGTKGCAF